MRGSLLTFQSELGKLKLYLSVMDKVIRFGSTNTTSSWPAEADDLTKVVRASGLPVFQTSFDGALLSLAADFEQFISGIVSEFLDVLPSRITRYEDLPEKIRSCNEQLTGEVLVKKGRYASLDGHKLVKNLHDCLDGIQPYMLNTEAILIIERNLTSRELADFLQRFGIRQFWEKISEDAKLQKWAGTTDSPNTLPRIQGKLNEFISDRNAVAHQGSSVISVGPSVILSYIEYFEALAPALLSMFEQYLLLLHN